jgi:hypothetical protein
MAGSVLGRYLRVLGVGLGVVGGVFFFPGEVVLFGGFDGAVAQALGVVARHHQLQGGEEGLDELFFLVVEVLADAFFTTVTLPFFSSSTPRAMPLT